VYTSLALVVLAGLLGPLLAGGKRLRVPVLVGELIGGIILGRTGLHLIDSGAQPFPVFASLGFAMLMLESGTEIDVVPAAPASPATNSLSPGGEGINPLPAT
jgi:Kef-type K+ transport system membrane component KefB